MTRASDFEFRNRWWIFATIFGATFFLLSFDPVPVGSKLADRLAAWARWPEPLALHVVFGAATLVMLAAALVRTWGSAYLGREVVHGASLHSEALRADGPYRHVRNPLYLGNVLMAFAMALFAPRIGCPILVIGIWLFCYRLIGREEAALEARQGEAYRAFERAVPRLWPSLRARIPATGDRPDWINGLAAEAFFWPYAIGVAGFAFFLNIWWFFIPLVLSPLVSWLAGLAIRGRKPSASASQA
jgi:protein-S-isoprenylcysteine O-methyltransferase Ste14